MQVKYPTITPELYDYVLKHTGVLEDDLLLDLRARTESLGSVGGMLTSHDQGACLTLLAMGAQNALEIGTFTGYSAICIARGLAPGGRLLCMDVSEEWTGIAREYWRLGGLADRIDLRLGPALETLAGLKDETFDFVFIDADKENYAAYYEHVLPRLRPNGMIVFDNMLWHGRVVDPGDNSQSTLAIRALNEQLTADPRVASMLLAIGDGFHICRKV